MENKIPSAAVAFGALIRADFTTQWRNRRAVIIALIVPVIILIVWKPLLDSGRVSGPFLLASSISLGLTAIGLMGYSNAVARDRDKGVFQRLRVAPVPSWYIMASRLLVQLFMIWLLTTLVFIVGNNYDHIVLQSSGYVLTYFTVLIGGAVYLGLGQMIVGWLKNAETVNSTSRLVYFVFIMVGMVGQLMLDKKYQKLIDWSPYGSIQTIIKAGMDPSSWATDTSLAFLLAIGYALVFAFLGIKWFRWSPR